MPALELLVVRVVTKGPEEWTDAAESNATQLCILVARCKIKSKDIRRDEGQTESASSHAACVSRAESVLGWERRAVHTAHTSAS